VDRSILSPWQKSRWGAEPLTQVRLKEGLDCMVKDEITLQENLLNGSEAGGKQSVSLRCSETVMYS
jgi:hypothetical protein